MRETILIVDDEMVLNLINKVLQKNNFNTITARNGLEGYNLYQEHTDNIKLIITDEHMPIMNGSEMINKIRESNNLIPIILISAIRPKDVNGYIFLQKPFNIEDMIDMVKFVMKAYVY